MTTRLSTFTQRYSLALVALSMSVGCQTQGHVPFEFSIPVGPPQTGQVSPDTEITDPPDVGTQSSDSLNSNTGSKSSDSSKGYLELGRFTYWWLGGIEISQDNGQFSETNPFIRFSGDTSWRPKQTRKPGDKPQGAEWDDIHTSFDLQLGTISALTTDPMIASGEEFLRSKKAVSLSLGIETRPLKLRNSQSSTGATDVLFLGPILRGGFHTLTDSAATGENVDTVNSWISGGLRIGSYVQGSDSINPPLLRYVDLTWGHHENYDDKRLTIEALLRTDPKTGFFVATQAHLGSGEDDVRLVVGFSLNLKGLENTVTGLGQIFPDN